MPKTAFPILILWSLGGLAAGPVAAESLYKCEGPGAAISIQSEPCPAGTTQVWKRDATPEPGPSAEELAARAAIADAEARRAAEEARAAEQARLAEAERREQEARRQAAGASGERPPTKSACTQAHDFSDAVLAKEFLRLTETQKADLRAWVVAQCADVYRS
ncbi:hypothetical protein [Arenimonas caeni]|jgi:hypothetical protein|uniref:hypothetical protein n=1 Tax=Arenimonas caeni TaxID=2058085 RepID=UPI002A35A3F7|nr:hypothetical protein [Arenimonas caeni]MDY0021905.1 hypothetical protein [Arenimonas caeni]